MQPTYATLINELMQGYQAKLANLHYATAIALDDAWAAGDIDSAAQIDSVIRQFYTARMPTPQALQVAA